MANGDPGAKPVILGLLLGAITVLGGPVGLVAAGIAGASAYGLGRAIRRSRTTEKNSSNDSGGLSDYKQYTDWSKHIQPQKDKISLPHILIPELTSISQLTTRDQEYNSTYDQINSIANYPRVSTEELNHLRELITPNREDNNTYTRINSIADSYIDSGQDEPEPIQRQSQRRTRIDEYGQIWEE